MTKISKKCSFLIALAAVLLVCAAGCGETEAPVTIPDTAGRVETPQETSANENNENADCCAPVLTADGLAEIFESDEYFFTSYLGYTIDTSTFTVTETEVIPKNTCRIFSKISVFSKDGSLERVLNCESVFVYKDNVWSFHDLNIRQDSLILHHAPEFSDDELKSILETCLGYEITEIPEYTVETSSFIRKDDSYDEHRAEYTFHLIDEEYTYGIIKQTLSLQFITRDYGIDGIGNDRIYYGGKMDWALFDNYGDSVRLSSYKPIMNYDWVELVLDRGNENPLYFNFNLNFNYYSYPSVYEGSYIYNFRGEYELQEVQYDDGSFDLSMIFPTMEYVYTSEEAAAEVTNYLSSADDASWLLGGGRMDTANLKISGIQVNDYIMRDARTGDIIPKEKVVTLFSDLEIDVTIGKTRDRVPAMFLVTYDDFYCVIPDIGIGGFTDDNANATTFVDFVKMDVLKLGSNE